MGGKLVTLKFVPRAQISWEEFIATHPPFSIALDGYVYGITRFDESGPWLNINHHEDCVRSATRSSCMQVFDAVRTGLFETFNRCGRHHAIVWNNDPDQDDALATYILCHPKHLERRRLKEMVRLQDLLDTVNGFFAVNRRWHLLKMMIWCFHPYAEARANGSLRKMDGEQMHALTEQIHNRIKLTMYGRGREEEPDIRYDVIERHASKFVVVKEVGVYARYEIARHGYDAFLSVAEHPNGRLQCTLARRSPFIARVPINDICRSLNEAEGLSLGKGWGGSDLGIGSPRNNDPAKHGTALPLETIVGIITDAIKKKEAGMCHGGRSKA